MEVSFKDQKQNKKFIKEITTEDLNCSHSSRLNLQYPFSYTIFGWCALSKWNIHTVETFRWN